MQTSRRDILRMIKRYRSGKATPEEQAFIESYYAYFDKKPQDFPGKGELEKEIGAFLSQHIQKGPKTIRLWPRIAAAASVILCLSAGGYFLLHRHKSNENLALQQHDIRPGHNQATLTLANGKKIVLTSGLSGRIAVQNHTVISATQSTITYQAIQQGDQVSYNTLSTARGEQSPFPLVLADGTKVWLNAESSITFPTAFTGKERLVTVSGEAYFEVKHDDRKPFRIKTAQMQIEDIGTKFDVMAYSDEQAATTLIEGSVKVNNALLKPGEQSDGKSIKEVNVTRFVAWKNNDFDFGNDNIQTIMRQLARWYDIDVTYRGDSNELFNAQISKKQNISVILKALERTGGVHFKIEGRRVTVIE